MSAYAQSEPSGASPIAAGIPIRTPGGEVCPLCGAGIVLEQEWCLRCGAAARTRLAPAPNWRAALALVAVAAVLSAGVLAASLVKLAGGSSTKSSVGSTLPPAASVAPAPAATTPGTATAGSTATAPTPPSAGATARTTTPAGASAPVPVPTATAPATSARPGPISPPASPGLRSLRTGSR